jgi:murein DD-endopeptidase MepM/ murein hydrolase activator NlpD
MKNLRGYRRTMAWAAFAALGAGAGSAGGAAAQVRTVTSFATAIDEVSEAAQTSSSADMVPDAADLAVPQERPLELASAPPVRIMIGAYNAAPGKPAYPVRQQVSGSGLVVSLSSTPQVQVSGGPALLPSRLPLSTGRLTSAFGSRVHPIEGVTRRHAGIDLAAAWGSPLQATQDGVVTGAGWNGGYGLLVVISHGGGVETRYAHLSRLSVAAGQTVKAGDTVGYVGSSGDSTGPHVHYEVRVNGVAIDPLAR